jgi:hypothetical protein
VQLQPLVEKALDPIDGLRLDARANLLP